MKKNRRQSAVLMATGVVALNLVYLWDLVLAKHGGVIVLGPWAWLGIVVANIVIAASLVTAFGGDREENQP